MGLAPLQDEGVWRGCHMARVGGFLETSTPLDPQANIRLSCVKTQLRELRVGSHACTPWTPEWRQDLGYFS